MFEGVLQDLIDELGRLPGIGPKGASRIAFHLLAAEPEEVARLTHAITEVKARTRYCNQCGNITQEETCNLCLDPRRRDDVICVVEEPKDIAVLERTKEFKGRYHVLGGAIDPIRGKGPNDLRIRELFARLADPQITEVILALDPNVEGEATAAYLARTLKDLDVTVSRLAFGLPVGGDLEYADEVTLGRALEGRTQLVQR